MPFASARACGETLYLRAIEYRVSPYATMCEGPSARAMVGKSNSSTRVQRKNKRRTFDSIESNAALLYQKFARDASRGEAFAAVRISSNGRSANASPLLERNELLVEIHLNVWHSHRNRLLWLFDNRR